MAADARRRRLQRGGGGGGRTAFSSKMRTTGATSTAMAASTRQRLLCCLCIAALPTLVPAPHVNEEDAAHRHHYLRHPATSTMTITEGDSQPSRSDDGGDGESYLARRFTMIRGRHHRDDDGSSSEIKASSVERQHTMESDDVVASIELVTDPIEKVERRQLQSTSEPQWCKFPSYSP